MKAVILLLAVTLHGSLGFASYNGHIFMCDVVGFDAKEVKLGCDPKRPEQHMKTPRKWLDGSSKLKSGSSIKLILNDENFEKWLVMNNSSMAKKKE